MIAYIALLHKIVHSVSELDSPRLFSVAPLPIALRNSNPLRIALPYSINSSRYSINIRLELYLSHVSQEPFSQNSSSEISKNCHSILFTLILFFSFSRNTATKISFFLNFYDFVNYWYTHVHATYIAHFIHNYFSIIHRVLYMDEWIIEIKEYQIVLFCLKSVCYLSNIGVKLHIGRVYPYTFFGVENL